MDTIRQRLLRGAECQIDEMETKIACLCRKVTNAVTNRRINGSEQLTRAVEQAEFHLRVAKIRLEELRGATDDGFEDTQSSLHDALEDLAQSIRKAVLRFP